ncbi:hypothetical protein DFH08DRAFT_814630 [Mycena albidolilacea]|uniref:Uncharacterized protein n=1 Tax=Mycena albidolilacea TaxID=1033008 RepID=A0AAD7EJN6_9AGAR|nr:hypothetical protein DFH08DRAFT_814630 [Mycena albidolilacea]
MPTIRPLHNASSAAQHIRHLSQLDQQILDSLGSTTRAAHRARPFGDFSPSVTGRLQDAQTDQKTLAVTAVVNGRSMNGFQNNYCNIFRKLYSVLQGLSHHPSRLVEALEFPVDSHQMNDRARCVPTAGIIYTTTPHSRSRTVSVRLTYSVRMTIPFSTDSPGPHARGNISRRRISRALCLGIMEWVVEKVSMYNLNSKFWQQMAGVGTLKGGKCTRIAHVNHRPMHAQMVLAGFQHTVQNPPTASKTRDGSKVYHASGH